MRGDRTWRTRVLARPDIGLYSEGIVALVPARPDAADGVLRAGVDLGVAEGAEERFAVEFEQVPLPRHDLELGGGDGEIRREVNAAARCSGSSLGGTQREPEVVPRRFGGEGQFRFQRAEKQEPIPR